jgi:hypothetical protein
MVHDDAGVSNQMNVVRWIAVDELEHFTVEAQSDSVACAPIAAE